MRIKYIIIIALLFFSMPWSPYIFISKADESDTLETELALHLTANSIPTTIQLIAENVGKKKLFIVRPFERAWNLRVDGPGGQFGPFLPPSKIISFTSNNLIELQPRQSFEAIISIADYICYQSPFLSNGMNYLKNTPGQYSVSLSYHFESNKVKSANGQGFVYVPPIDRVKSAHLTIIVVERKWPSFHQIVIMIVVLFIITVGIYIYLRVSKKRRRLTSLKRKESSK